ncbi:unnamed protein product [Rodentolepis nana]|uniref:BPTI/Kunitz inhibitor domain-containing protein n=1 Tax=Rodentolepis nana TaxID=102285 RepID=A0A0R3TKU5_RODNA|nr:unnamed protein product [Rodentolepis nana]
MKILLILFLAVSLVVCEAQTDYCQLPIEPGPCRAYLPRWAMNSKTGQCEVFIYGGCRGNKNNFKTLEECETLHKDCMDPIETGRGRAYFQRYGYDQSTQKCRQFIWGGCDANRNNFETLEECQSKCEHGKSHCAII